MRLSKSVLEFGGIIQEWPDTIKDAAVKEWLLAMSIASPNEVMMKHDEVNRILLALNVFMSSNGSVDQISNLKNDLYAAIEQDLITEIERIK